MASPAPPASARSLADVEAASRRNIVTRRNYLLAVWAGGRLGLRDEALAGYVAEVMDADLQQPGVDDVIQKIVRDLGRAGGPANADDVLAALVRAERSARDEILSTD